MLNFGGGSAAGALIVTNSNPNELLSATKLTPIVDSVTGQPVCCGDAVLLLRELPHLPYNSMRGDPYFDLDARLAKNIKIGESRNLQLMFQAFNLTNHANYGNNFGSTVRIPTFGNAIGFHQPDQQLPATCVHW